MNPVSRYVGLMVLCCGVAAIGANQKSEIRIETIRQSADNAAAPGQIFELFLSGLGNRMIPPIPANRFDVLVVQDGVAHHAKVRGVASVMINPTASRDLPPPSDGKPLDIAEQMAMMKPYQMLMFMVPLELHEGEATVLVTYGGNRSDQSRLNIVNRPPKPRIFAVVEAASLGPRMAPVPPPGGLKISQALEFTKGEETRVMVSPLIDPEAPDAAVLVTFKQGSASHEVNAKVTRVDSGQQRPGSATVIFAPARYEVSLKAPDELTAGSAEIEVRLRVNGHTSEPVLEKATIIDGSAAAPSAASLAPRIANMGQARIGMGQAIRLAVFDSQRLKPDPLKTVVIIEQDSRQVELKPEMNSAAYADNSIALLSVRFGDELHGKVLVRVLNPAIGRPAGLSDPIELEIVDEVVPPIISKVSEASQQDLAVLSEMRDQVLKTGREFQEYDPRSRYVTIRATGLDYNPNFLRIEFRNNARSYVLKFEDFSLTTGDRLVVRLPNQIQPGPVQITIQNRGLDRLSEPVIATFEVTQSARSQR